MLLLTLVFLFASIFSTALYLWFRRNFNYWQRYPQIPSVKGKIFSGSVKDIVTFKTNFGFQLQKIAEDSRYENEAVVGIYGLYKPALLIREPELLKAIFIKDFDLFRNRSCEAGRHDISGTLNLFLARYPYWREMRSKLAPVFSSRKLKYMYPLMEKVGENLQQILSERPDRFRDDVNGLCSRYTTDIMSSAILGNACNSIENPQELLFIEAQKFVAFSFKRALHFLIIFFAPKLNGLFKTRFFYKSTEDFIGSYIKQTMAQRETLPAQQHDLIDQFVDMKQEAQAKGEDVANFTQGLVAQTCILLTAAFDASANTISFTLLELAKHQQIQQTLREEIIQAFLKDGGKISYQTLNSLEYLQMVINESLRLYPILPLYERMHEFHPNRVKGFSLKPFYDYELPHQMPVYVSVLALHHNKKFWPQPEVFNPERFRAANKRLVTEMTFMPFGKGPHMCIGSRLGMLQTKIAIVNFLKNHFVRTYEQTVIKPKFEPKALMLQTKGGIHVEFIRDNLFLKATTGKVQGENFHGGQLANL